MKERLLDGRTWKAVIYIAAACLLKTFPDQTQNILTGAFGLSAVVSLFFRDSPAPATAADLAAKIPATLEELKPK
jgi:hypothetical protein